jgi:glycosyltransferase involved in cell wall biosynthesis
VTGEADAGRRVAFVVGTASGGTASHVMALAEGCRAAGVEVSVFGPAQTLELLAVGTGGLAVGIGHRPRPGRDALAVLRLRAGLAIRRPDVVHAHGVRAGAFAALAIAALPPSRLAISRQPTSTRPGRGRPALAVTVHNAPPAGRAARIFYSLLERICARRAGIVLCASADLLARMRARGASAAEQFDVPARLAPVPAAADVAAARSAIRADGRPVVLAVARLAPQKGLDVLIDAASRWCERHPQPLTVIAGDGPLAADLRAQASRNGADVVLLGTRDDVPVLLAVADVVAVPSRWEARALIIQEAMRLGRPVVATSVGGTPELTGADGALLVPPDDVAALAEAVAAVLDDASLAARLGEAAKQRSAAFGSQQDAVRAALAIYARLAANWPAPGDGASSG